MVRELVQDMMIGPALEPLARAVRGWVSTTGRNDRQTARLMDRILRPNSNCVHVGCGDSYMLREMLRRATQGRHLATDPIPEKFAVLKAKFPQVTLFNVATSDRAGEAAFPHAASQSTFGGLARRRCIAEEAQRKIRVLTARLDDLIPSDLAVRFIKVDVEVAELPVFRGALGLIRRCHPYIVFQHHPGDADENDATPEEVYDLLTRNGLAISLTEDWLRGHSPVGRQAFCDQFAGDENFGFMAHP